jgi:catechol 2,3-dioxygenase-like lactoylglutathione lyase family enzyme
MTDELWTRPIFRVRDVEASIAYYCEKLGFNKHGEHGEDRLIIAEVGRSGLDLILDSSSVLPRPAAPSVLTLSLHKPETLGALHREFQERGAKIVAPPFAVIWQEGSWELDVEDLDGNVLVFWGQNPASSGPVDGGDR